MKTRTSMKLRFTPILGWCAAAAYLTFMGSNARANVYATDIKVNSSLSSVTNSPTPSSPVTISYILNQTATLGCTVSILNGNSVVTTIAGGTNMGLNKVLWGGTNHTGAAVSGGTYTVSITASAADVSGGSNVWTQISIDGTNTAALYPQGMDVDKNTNSPYYGRVIVGCAADGTIYGIPQTAGFYKANADGSPADEGAYGYADYTTNDFDGTIIPGEISTNGEVYHGNSVPGIIRIGEDDRIYFIDQTVDGAVVATDMQATTNQVVICEGPGSAIVQPSGGYPTSLNNYADNPDGDLLNVYGEGWGQFDVAGFATGHPAIYLDDTGDYPSAGVWVYHLVNGASDTNDTVGTQTVEPNPNPVFNPAAIIVTSGGLSVDDNLDIFVADDRSDASTNVANDPSVLCNRVFCFTNWNKGVLPPEGDGSQDTYAYTSGSNAFWGVGTTNDQLSGINDTVINSRSHPTLVAVAMLFGAPQTNGYDSQNGGIAILNATNGAYVVTNLDPANFYTSAAFDNVGNVYGCSTSANYWRVWSPPGANTNTTVAVAQIVISAPLQITGITAVPAAGGCSIVTITFTSPTSLPPTRFEVKGSATVNGAYSVVTGAVVTGSNGTYQATFTNCSTQFFVIEQTGQILTL